MIKQLAQTSCKAVVTPKAFVKAGAAGSKAPVYDWQSQKNTAACAGTFRETFRNPSQWETD